MEKRKVLRLKYFRTPTYDDDGCLSEIPTFPEFMEYLVKFPDRHADHWDIVSKKCYMCNFK